MCFINPRRERGREIIVSIRWPGSLREALGSRRSRTTPAFTSFILWHVLQDFKAAGVSHYRSWGHGAAACRQPRHLRRRHALHTTPLTLRNAPLKLPHFLAVTVPCMTLQHLNQFATYEYMSILQYYEWLYNTNNGWTDDINCMF